MQYLLFFKKKKEKLVLFLSFACMERIATVRNKGRGGYKQKMTLGPYLIDGDFQATGDFLLKFFNCAGDGHLNFNNTRDITWVLTAESDFVGFWVIHAHSFTPLLDHTEIPKECIEYTTPTTAQRRISRASMSHIFSRGRCATIIFLAEPCPSPDVNTRTCFI